MGKFISYKEAMKTVEGLTLDFEQKSPKWWVVRHHKSDGRNQ